MNNTVKPVFFNALLALMLCLSAFVSQATGVAKNSEEKIFIDADHVRLNIETGYSEYTGNVKITQGELVLTGDKVTVLQSNNEVEHITVIGKPAHYRNLTEKGEILQAESEQMVYTASKNELILTINAEVKQPDHTIKSQRIVYDTEKKIVIAGNKDNPSSTNNNTKQRVNITLTPKKAPTLK
jgi:lipopolysaccharide export system protein LptA